MRTDIDIGDRLIDWANRLRSCVAQKAAVHAERRLLGEIHAQSSVRALRGKIVLEDCHGEIGIPLTPGTLP